MLWTLSARIQSHQNIKHFQRGLENGVHNAIQCILCCSVLQMETYMLAYKSCIALGVKIALSKDSLAYVKACKCGGFIVQQQTQTLQLHSFTAAIWSMIWIDFVDDSREIRAQLYFWEGSLDLCFFSDDLKNALDKLWDDQTLDLCCLYLRWRRRKSVVLCRAALTLLLSGVVTDCKYLRVWLRKCLANVDYAGVDALIKLKLSVI